MSNLSHAFDYIRRRVGSELYDRLPPYNPKKDYIGPEAWTKIKELEPLAKIVRFAWGIDLNLAGWVHDGLYLIGGGEEERQLYDQIFLEVMHWLIERQALPVIGQIQKRLAKIRARELHALVRRCGPCFFSYREVR